jgi:predicted RNase H-like HicB family nuclease
VSTTMERQAKEKRSTKAGREPAPNLVHSLFAAVRKAFNGPEDSRETIGEAPDVEHRAAWSLTISVEADECDGGFVAECSEVPGAMGQGETEDEAIHSLLEAINAIVAVRVEQQLGGGEAAAAPHSGARIVSVSF